MFFLKDHANRQALKNEMLFKRTKELQRQIDYLQSHIDIRHIRPAGGKLREWQLTCVKTAAELLGKLNELGINPFLCSGNLIGYVRHNGFVPWDDDMDFTMMRKDYGKLRRFFGQHMYTEKEFYGGERVQKEGQRGIKMLLLGQRWRR